MKDSFSSKLKKIVTDFDIKRFLSNYKFTIILILFLFVVAYFQIGRLYGKNVLSIFCIVLFMNGLSKTKYLHIVHFFMIVFIIFDAYFAFVYGQILSESMAASILETNAKEASGMLSGALPLLIGLIVGISFLYIKSVSELRQSRIPRWFSYSTIGVIFLVAMPIYILRQQSKTKKSSKFINSSGVVNYINSYSSNTLIMGSITKFIQYKSEVKTMKNYGKIKRELPQGVSLDEKRTEDSPTTLFIIIGESSLRDHYSLYGYHRATTPFLDSMRDDSVAFAYKNGLSAAFITRDAVPMALSFASPLDQQTFYSQMNVVDLARNAGYETIWISAQEPVRLGENCVSYLAATADTCMYKMGDEGKDLLLAQEINKMISPDKKQCFLLHTVGSHEPYHAQSEEEDAIAIPGKNRIDEYDRTIHYTDRFIGAMNNIAQNYKPSVVYYFSDHGEVVGKGHGMKHGGLVQFKVPILVFNYSDLPVSSIVDRYQDKERDLLSTSNNVYILAQIMGYNIAEEVAQKARSENNYVYMDGSNAYTSEEVEAMKR